MQRRHVLSACIALLVLMTGIPVAAAAPLSLSHAGGGIVFTFNAGYASHVQAAQILEAHGMHGTFYVVSSQIRQGPYYAAYLSATDVANLSAAGHEIGSMTVTQVDLTTVDATRLNAELANSQTTLQSMTGKPVRQLAYPYGSVNTAVASATATYYDTGRTVTTTTAAFTSSVDSYHLPGLMVVQATSLAAARSYVDYAISQNVFVVLSFERIVTTPGTYDWTPSNLDALAAYVQSKNLAVYTVGQVVSGTPPPSPTPPGAPALAATAGVARVNLSWSAPSTGGSAILGYNVSRGTTSGAETPLASLGPVTSYADVNVTGGTTYFYKVTARNAVGTGNASNEASATPLPAPTPPAAPTLAATAGLGRVNLSWTTPADGGSPILGYNLSRGTASGAETPLASLGVQTSYSDASVTNGTTYYYKVTARNAVGTGNASNEASATPLSGATIPGAPSLAANATVGRVDLSWTSPPDGGSPITGYNLSRGTASGGEVLLATLGTQTTYADVNVTNGTTYYYTVAARNAIGTGNASNEVAATPPLPSAPTAPALTATAGVGRVDLSWTTPSDGGSPILGYNLSRGIAPGEEVPLATLDATSYADLNVTNGTTYFYTVAAWNSAGTGNASNEANATPFAVPATPAAPALSATAGPLRVNLSWTTPANGGSAITGYRVYRGTTSGGETLFRNLGVTTSFTDLNVTSGTAYFYQVAAVNAVGEGNRSNEASATPNAPVATAPGRIVFTFDDGYPTQTLAAQILEEHGFRGTFFIISDCPRAETGGACLTPAQVQNLSIAGHDIESHTQRHPDLTTVSKQRLTRELANSQRTLQTLVGKPVLHFAYPYGAHDARVEAAVAKYYKTARIYLTNPDPASLGDLLAQSGSNPYLLPGIGITRSTSLARAQAYVDYAIANDATIVLSLHDLLATGGDEYTWSPAEFSALADYVASKGTTVSTIAQAYPS